MTAAPAPTAAADPLAHQLEASALAPGLEGVADQGAGPTMMVASGRLLPLLDPRPEHIDIEDIAEHLAKLCRFTGAIDAFYSVAQHSAHVHDLVTVEARPWALLHDAHEAYLGDVSRPLKLALRALGSDAFDTLTERWDAAIHAAAGLAWPPPPAIAAQIAQADATMLATERRDLMPDPAGPEDAAEWPGLPPPATWAILALPWSGAWVRFLERFDACCRLHPPLAALRRRRRPTA